MLLTTANEQLKKVRMELDSKTFQTRTLAKLSHFPPLLLVSNARLQCSSPALLSGARLLASSSSSLPKFSVSHFNKVIMAPKRAAGGTMETQQRAPKRAAGGTMESFLQSRSETQQHAPKRAAGGTMETQQRAPKRAAGGTMKSFLQSRSETQQHAPKRVAGGTMETQQRAPKRAAGGTMESFLQSRSETQQHAPKRAAGGTIETQQRAPNVSYRRWQVLSYRSDHIVSIGDCVCGVG